jgi:hypothetical protein
MKITVKLWIFLGVLVAFSPLGLFLPLRFRAGSAWGEWSTEEIKNMVGYIPKGLGKLSDLWRAPFPEYAFKGYEEKGLFSLSFAYMISAVLGIILIVLLVLLIGKSLARDNE